MLVFWRIRYLDRSDKKPKDRDLYLLTSQLNPADRAAVEYFMETKTTRTERDVFKFRHLFSELKDKSLGDLMAGEGKMDSVCLTNYIEDEDGKELTGQELGQILTGNPECELLFAPLEPHDLEFRNSVATPIPLASVVLTDAQLKTLGYFCRDLRELANTAFFKEENPATLRSGGDLPLGESVLETAATDEEIRSFVTIFRRLALTNEAGNFAKAAGVFAKVLNDHPLANWVLGAAQSFKSKLNGAPTFTGFGPCGPVNFDRKRLIEVFVYTQYAHQPNDLHIAPDKQRERQFAECLQEIGGQKSLLTWLFLCDMHFSGRQIHAAGRVIAAWFDRFCTHHKITVPILKSLLHEHPGIGTIEKDSDKKERVLGEKTKQLADDLCAQAGLPPSESVRFLHQAHEQLTKAINEGVGQAASSHHVRH